MQLTDPTAAAMLQDILEHPADDAVRLIYADWLTDHGEEERAEFIRVQCELASGWSDHDDFSHQGTSLCRGCVLRRCERDLFSRLSTRFDADLPESLVSCISRWYLGNRTSIGILIRGFVAKITCPAQTWLAPQRCEVCKGVYKFCTACNGTGKQEPLGQTILAQHPVEQVTLTGRNDGRVVITIGPLASGGYFSWSTVMRNARSQFHGIHNHRSRDLMIVEGIDWLNRQLPNYLDFLQGV